MLKDSHYQNEYDSASWKIKRHFVFPTVTTSWKSHYHHSVYSSSTIKRPHLSLLISCILVAIFQTKEVLASCIRIQSKQEFLWTLWPGIKMRYKKYSCQSTFLRMHCSTNSVAVYGERAYCKGGLGWGKQNSEIYVKETCFWSRHSFNFVTSKLSLQRRVGLRTFSRSYTELFSAIIFGLQSLANVLKHQELHLRYERKYFF